MRAGRLSENRSHEKSHIMSCYMLLSHAPMESPGVARRFGAFLRAVVAREDRVPIAAEGLQPPTTTETILLPNGKALKEQR